MAMALDQGAKQIIACLEIEESQFVAARCSPPPLLCGERFCKPIPGFDLGNSPIDYSRSIVGGRTLVMTTTNGTRAFAAAISAKSVYAGAFVNLSAVLRAASGEGQLIVICAGTDGQETDEDLLFAGALIAKLADSETELALDEAATEASDAWHAFMSTGISLAERLSQSRGGRNLLQAGFQADIKICAMIDSVASVPKVVARQPMTLEDVRLSK